MNRTLFAIVLGVKMLAVPTHALAQSDTARMTKVEWAVTGLMTVGSTADVVSTLRMNPTYFGESNGLAAPFVSPKHPEATYAFNVARVAAIMWLGHEFKHSSSPVLRKLWWVPGVVFTSVSIMAANHNVQAAAQCRVIHPDC